MPSPPASRTVDLGGPVHYVDHGGEGPPIVLVHGLGGSHLNWMRIAEGLARHGRVVALDLPGFGRSRSAGQDLTMEGQRRLLGRFVEAICGAEPALLVGNSMGGALSLLEAHAEPARVSRLVLIAPAQPLVRARYEPAMAAAAMLGMPGLGSLLLRRRAARGPERAVLDLMRLCVADLDDVPRDVLDAHVALGVERAAWAEDNRRDFTRVTRGLTSLLLGRRAYHKMVREVPARALVIQGARDPLVQPEASQAICALRPDWHLVMLDNVGHVPQLEAPGRVLDEIAAWLRESPANGDAATRGQTA